MKENTENTILVENNAENTVKDNKQIQSSKSALRKTLRKRDKEFTELNPSVFMTISGKYGVGLMDTIWIIESAPEGTKQEATILEEIQYSNHQFNDVALALIKLGEQIILSRGGGNTSKTSQVGVGSGKSATLRKVLIKNGWSAVSLSTQTKGEFSVVTRPEQWELLKGETSIRVGEYGRGTAIIIKTLTGDIVPKEKVLSPKAAKRAKKSVNNNPLAAVKQKEEQDVADMKAGIDDVDLAGVTVE